MNSLVSNDMVQMPDMAQLLADVPAPAALVENKLFASQDISQAHEHTVFHECSFKQVHWQGPLERVRFVRCRFEGVQWHSMRCRDVSWEDCEFDDVRWTACHLDKAAFVGGSGRSMQFLQSKISYSCVAESKWQDVSFRNCTLVHWNGSNTTASELAFVSSILHDVVWVTCQVANMTLDALELMRFICSACVLANLRVSQCIGKGNHWIECEMTDAHFDRVTFTQCAWTQSRWTGGSISSSRLDFAAFNEAHLTGVQWIASHCERALFDDAVIVDCDLRGQHMPDMSLRAAHLLRVDLRGIQSPRLDARGARLEASPVDRADMSNAVLHGQPERDWRRARLAGASFQDAADLNDERWWARNAPGPQPKEERRA